MSGEPGRGRAAAAGAHQHAASPADDARLARAREALHTLRTHFAALLLFRADDADLERRARRLCTAIAEVLEEPHGHLARALRAWPPRDETQRRRVDAALLRADALRDEAERITLAHEARRELRARLARLEDRYAARLPALWYQLVQGGELAARISRASTARGALAVAESLARAKQALERRAADLAELEQQALARVRPADRPRLEAALQDADLEARLSAVLHVAAERAAEQRAEYVRAVARATERYVASMRGAAPRSDAGTRTER